MNSYTTWQMTFWPHWDIGGVFIIDFFALIIGMVLMFIYAAIRPAFFRGEVLNRDTPTLVPESLGTRGRSVRDRSGPGVPVTGPGPVEVRAPGEGCPHFKGADRPSRHRRRALLHRTPDAAPRDSA